MRLLAVSLILIISGCDGGSEVLRPTVTIEVDGTSGMWFSGNISDRGVTRTVYEQVPQTYFIHNAEYPGGVFQKEEPDGILTVTMIKSYLVVDENSTIYPYGSVAVGAAVK